MQNLQKCNFLAYLLLSPQYLSVIIHVLASRKTTCESRWTAAGKSIHLIVTRSTMLTWITSTFVDVRHTTITCKRNWTEIQSKLTKYNTTRSIELCIAQCCFWFLPRAAMHKRGLCQHAVSVRPSVTFVSCAKTNKDIFEIFSPSVAKPF